MLFQIWAYYLAGNISKLYIDPSFHFKYYGFEWVHPWPGIGMYVHFLFLGILAFCILIGLFYRIATVLFFLGITYVFLLDQATYLNHSYLICLISFCLIFVPAHRYSSVDAHFLFPKIQTQKIPAWSLWLLRGQLGLVYFFAGLAKINPDWLRGEPMRWWLSRNTDFPLLGRFFTEEWMVYLFSYGGLFLDLLFFPLVLWKKTRIPMLIAGAMFHILNAQLFHIGIFPFFMLAANLLFLSPDWPKIFLRKNRSHGEVLIEETIKEKRRILITWLLGIYFAIQVLVPCRHLLYPGEVAWSEEGHRFSWRMMLRDKKADIHFWLKDTRDSEEQELNPLNYLNSEQFKAMVIRPDMIQQFAQHVVQKRKDEGYPEASLRIESKASLNRREEQTFLDSSVDLSKEKRSLKPAKWIRPYSR